MGVIMHKSFQGTTANKRDVCEIDVLEWFGHCNTMTVSFMGESRKYTNYNVDGGSVHMVAYHGEEHRKDEVTGAILDKLAGNNDSIE